MGSKNLQAWDLCIKYVDGDLNGVSEVEVSNCADLS